MTPPARPTPTARKRRRAGVLRLAVAQALVLAWCAAATAQLAVGGHRAADSAEPQHAWAVAPTGEGAGGQATGGWALWHLPPRGAGGARDGAARPVVPLEKAPQAIAAAGQRLWMAFPGGGSSAGYTILTTAAIPGAIDGTWFTGGGRLQAAPFLPTRGKVVAMAADAGRPIALIHRTDGPAALAWLERGRWRTAPAPDAQPPPTALGVLATGTVALASVDGAAIRLWTATLPASPSTRRAFELLEPDAPILTAPRQPAPQADTSPPPAALAWSASSAHVPADAPATAIVAGPVAIDGRTVLALAGDEGRGLYELSEGALFPIADVGEGAVALLARDRRAIVLRRASRAEGVDGAARTSLVVRELSLDTGRTLYEGPVAFDGPISPSDLRLLFVLMVAASAAILLFIVRTSAEGAPFVTPAGLPPAPPLPRVLAGIVDATLALLVGGELARLLPEGWLAIGVGRAALDFAPPIMAIVVGAIACATLESLTGRSPGKLLFALAVVRGGPPQEVGDTPRPPGIGRSLVRNAVRWLLPPLALGGVLGPTRRHRGDSLTACAVVSLADRTDAGRDQAQDADAADR